MKKSKDVDAFISTVLQNRGVSLREAADALNSAGSRRRWQRRTPATRLNQVHRWTMPDDRLSVRTWL